MIPDVSWMVAADSLILLFMSEHRWRIAVNPTTVALNTGMSQSHANRRMKFLSEANLVEMHDERGYYRITDTGTRFILGELTSDEICELERRDPTE